jgi:hypothetical protein
MMVRAAMRWSLVATVAMMAAATAQAQDQRLGTYEYVSGKTAEGEIPKDRLVGKVKVTEDMILLLNAEGEEQFAISFQLESEEMPYKVTLRIERAVFDDAVGATAKALAKHEGDTATLIYAYGDAPDFPDDFEPDGQQRLLVLKRIGD